MKKFNVTLILVLCIKLSFAQSDFEKHVSIDSSTAFWNTVKVNTNKDILVFGNDWGLNPCSYMLDSNGNMKWSHRYYIPIDPIHNNYVYYSFNDFAFTNDGGFMLTGSTSDSTYKPALALFRFDSTGNLMWTRRHHFYRADYGISILPRSNGNFAICAGTKKTYPWASLPAIHFLIIDSIGNILKSKRISNDSIWFTPTSMKAMGNNYIIEGGCILYTSSSFIPGYFLMKLDNSGNVLNTKFVNAYVPNWDPGLEITHDNKILYSFPDGPPITYNLMKLDENLNASWCKTISPGSMLPFIAESPDSNYLMLGTRAGYGLGCKMDTSGNVISAFRTTYLNGGYGLKISPYGNKIFVHTLAAPSGQLTESMFFTTDLNLNATCYTSLIGLNTTPSPITDSLITINYFANYFPVQEDSIYVTTSPLNYFIEDLCAPNVINEMTSPPQIEIFPNPANTTLYLTSFKSEHITIINLIGETIIEKNLPVNNKGRIELDVSSLSCGIYFIKAGNEVRKFVKE